MGKRQVQSVDAIANDANLSRRDATSAIALQVAKRTIADAIAAQEAQGNDARIADMQATIDAQKDTIDDLQAQLDALADANRRAAAALTAAA